MDPIYLDHAATSPLRPTALAAMLPWLQAPGGNPSAAHGPGRRSRAAIDAARDELAGIVGSLPREITFTGGGTEADNLAVRGVIDRWGGEIGRHLVVSAVEHEAVLATAERLAEAGAAELTVVGCDADGRVDPAEVASAVRPDTVLVSVMLANNEVGTLQDVTAVAEAVRLRNPSTLVHSDAVQALGRLAINFADLGVDLMSLSGHKTGGPVGVGALVVRHGVFVNAQHTGGGQERGRRSGTENVAGIVAFGAAAAEADAERPLAMAAAVDIIGQVTKVLRNGIDGLEVTGSVSERLPGHLSALVPGCRSEILLARLDEAGVAVSAGSACASGAPAPSHVLIAMGRTASEAATALRLSLGPGTTAPAALEAAHRIVACVRALRAVGESPGRGALVV